MINIEQAQQAWENAFNSGTREERIARNAKVSLYFNYLAARQDADKLPSKDDSYALALVRDCGLHTDSTVLDVGCGAGGAALTFAKKCKSVAAIDMCSEMLRVARRRAELTNANNVSFTELLWENFTAPEKFDLCYAAMCGGICNLNELLRFESYSRKSCAVVTIGYKGKVSARNRLRETITSNPLPGLLAEGIYLFDLLYAMGRRPNVIETSSRSVSKLTVDEAIKRFSIYYGAYGYDDELSQKRMLEYIKSNAQDGMWVEDDEVTTMLIYWNVPKENSGV
ncbi:hypothetical protein AGMMS50255_5370 [Spirochaetia bacterium]|nr:hypothetical protein AGMMS50255_5370 [Spirochaetia bacterium]